MKKGIFLITVLFTQALCAQFEFDELFEDIGYWLSAVDLEIDHRASNPHADIIECHIKTYANAKKLSCKDREHVSSQMNVHCVDCQAPLQGLPANDLDGLFNLARYSSSSASNSPAKIMANEIVKISETFKIDAGIFASLLGHESGFCKTAQSYTGARGLGQITQPAYNEVRHQLFGHTDYKSFGWKGQVASREGQLYFRRMANEMGLSLSTLRNVSRRDLLLEENWKINLFFAAATLKIKLANASKAKRRSIGSGELKLKTRENIFKVALNSYNGASQAEQNKHYSETMCQYQKIYFRSIESVLSYPVTPSTCRQILRKSTCGQIGGPVNNT